VVSITPGKTGRTYRTPTAEDIEAIALATRDLEKFGDERLNESLPPRGALGFRVQLYGMSTWGDIFTPRQQLANLTYARLTREFVSKKGADDPSYSEALSALLGLFVNKLADLNASLCGWQLSTPNTAHVFTRWVLPMIMDFGETNPLAQAGGSPESAGVRMAAGLRWIKDAQLIVGSVERSSATKLPLPDDVAQAVITDPPYYDAVPYSYLSDFFYVWLRRTVGAVLPDLFRTPLTEKQEECIVDEISGKSKEYFERTMRVAMEEARRVMAPGGIGVVIFAHKSTAGWESQLQAMISAGWSITASWPIDTEMASRLRAMNSAALASSVHLVCRPRELQHGDEIGEWRQILQELPRRMNEWMPRLAEEGVVGADAIFACLGPALEIFSRYSRVEKANGDEVTLKEYLEQVWAAVAKEALAMIFTGADTTGFEEDARLTAMWLWTVNAGNGSSTTEDEAEPDETEEDSEEVATKAKTGGFVLEYDAARKIAQGLGAHLEDMRSLVEIKGDVARLLPVSERARLLFGKTEGLTPTGSKKVPQLDLFKLSQRVDEGATIVAEPVVEEHGATVLDCIHQSMIVFAAGRSEALKRFLVEDGVGRDARFWSLAQALSALYPASTNEKRWIDGVLARKKGLGL
jgi:adenine-specific DNA methylase